MVRILCAVAIVTIIGLAAFGAITLYDETMQVGRMWETPAIRPHEEPLPVMAGGSVPYSDGEIFLRTADPDTLKPAFGLDDAQTIAQGKLNYRYFCIHCHGPNYDGYGTVGQSFAPKPGDLRSARVQTLPIGRLFHEISYGIPNGRQPALATTIAIDDRWRIIAYIKTLGVRP
ncbi:MAG: c-type cytochrome [Desulfobacteraceae bacterium]|nr:c-type cytochrome [Desulfobacteraceae bacterium]